MDYTITPTSLIATETEEDPDGADRGGFHQQTDELEVKGDTLHLSFSVSDYWRDRFGDELPDPSATNKQEALDWIDGIIRSFQRRIEELGKLRANVEATTQLVTDLPEREEEDEDEDFDEEDDD